MLGGLAGVGRATALVRHAHLEIHVSEPAPGFSERSAGICLSTTARGAGAY